MGSKNYLIHHGIKKQKWGVRRWQNPDGSLTPAGKIRYGSSEGMRQVNKATITKDKQGNRVYSGGKAQEAANISAKVVNAVKSQDIESKASSYEKVIHTLEIIGGIAATAGTVITVAKKSKGFVDTLVDKSSNIATSKLDKKYNRNFGSINYNGAYYQKGRRVDAGTGGNRDYFDNDSWKRFF